MYLNIIHVCALADSDPVLVGEWYKVNRDIYDSSC